MTPQELKRSIIQLAIQGKLGTALYEDGTGQELLDEIYHKKDILVKSKIIKREKPLPSIEEDEIPFDIPDNWIWVRLRDICTKIVDGDHNPPAGEKNETEYWMLSAQNVNCDRLVNLDQVRYLSEASFKKANERTALKTGDILFTIVATLGRSCVYEGNYNICFQRSVSVLTTLIYNYYLKYVFDSGYIQEHMVANATGTAQKGFYLNQVEKLLIPIPPLAEQKRIVAKIEELLPLIDRYERAWSKLEDFNKRFPVDMQKSILQMAIQGKLVPQLPEEGTGEELYQQIQAEKQELIKAGKIKKEMPLSEITEDEIPFDIPEGWKWARIGQIFNLQAGKNITAADIYDEMSNEHRYLCYGGNGVRGYVSDFNREGHYALIGRQGALCGNINVAEGQFYATEHAVVVDHFSKSDVAWCAWFLKALNLNQYATATAQPGLAVANIVKVLIPLPPLAEQKRIVAKLEEILPLCERLK